MPIKLQKRPERSLVKIKTETRWHAITVIIIIVVLIPIVLFFIVPWVDEEVAKVFRVPPKSPILLSVDPEMVNLTILDNMTVTKRIDLNFGTDAVNLLGPTLDIPPGLDKNMEFIFNNATKTRQYFVYIIANNSNYVFPAGQFEGIIRFYYKDGNQTLNKAIPIDVNVIESGR